MEGFDIRSFHVNKPRCFFTRDEKSGVKNVDVLADRPTTNALLFYGGQGSAFPSLYRILNTRERNWWSLIVDS